ncbi:MAG: nitroreductase family protein [Archaeoglobaceae archaeon]
MRDCLKLIFDRKSIRKFKNDQLTEDILLEVLNAGNAAPTAGNLQARDFVVVRDNEKKKLVAEAAMNQMFIADAPVVIVVCANYPRSMRIYGKKGKLYAEQDATAAIENILIAACALDLGATWVGAFDGSRLSEILEIPKDAKPVAIIPLGYPDEEPEKRSRYPVEELIHWDKW